MIRLRYVLVAVIVLALVPWALDSLPSLSCVIPTADCLQESTTAVSDAAATPSASPAPVVLPKPTAAPPGANVASSPPATASARESRVGFTATLAFGGMMTLKWRVSEETGIDYYLLDRKLKGANDDAFERHVAMQAVDGSGDYSWTDTPPRDTGQLDGGAGSRCRELRARSQARGRGEL